VNSFKKTVSITKAEWTSKKLINILVG